MTPKSSEAEIFTRRMPFLLSKKQLQSTAGKTIINHNYVERITVSR